MVKIMNLRAPLFDPFQKMRMLTHWYSLHDGVECRSTEMGKSLVIDYQRNNAINGGEWGECSYLPSGAEKAQDILNSATIDEDDDWYDEVRKSLKESCHLTLHVLNVREFHVMSVLDKTRFDAYPDFSGEVVGRLICVSLGMFRQTFTVFHLKVHPTIGTSQTVIFQAVDTITLQREWRYSKYVVV